MSRSGVEEMKKFRGLLTGADVFWYDDSSLFSGYTVLRTKGEGFSCIWGFGSYGNECGLLEVMLDGQEPEGFLTAEEAFDLCTGR